MKNPRVINRKLIFKDFFLQSRMFIFKTEEPLSLLSTLIGAFCTFFFYILELIVTTLPYYIHELLDTALVPDLI